MVKYRVELMLTVPPIAAFFAWYLYIGLEDDSPAQHPEKLYRKPLFLLCGFLLLVLITVLSLVDIPVLHKILESVFTD